MSPTITQAGTIAGSILGTASYMSPEQARGKPLDRRSDVWSFGCILYETLAGERAFPGETISDVIAKVIQGEPDWSLLPKSLPPGIRRLLGRCLQKDAEKRIRDIGDARLEMAEALAAPTEAHQGAGAHAAAGGTPRPRKPPRGRLAPRAADGSPASPRRSSPAWWRAESE